MAGIEPLRLGPSVVLAVLITAGVAALIGVGALRVRGLLLAVVTFAFALAASQYLYDRPILSGGSDDSVPLRRTSCSASTSPSSAPSTTWCSPCSP